MLPEHTKAGIDNYVKNHIPCGSFLQAVLCNDLRGACENADDINKHNLFDIVSYLYNHTPYSCWGSKDNYENWIAGEKTI